MRRRPGGSRRRHPSCGPRAMPACTSCMKAWKWTRRLASIASVLVEEVHQHRLAAPDPAPEVDALRRFGAAFGEQPAQSALAVCASSAARMRLQHGQDGPLRRIGAQLSVPHAGGRRSRSGSRAPRPSARLALAGPVTLVCHATSSDLPFTILVDLSRAGGKCHAGRRMTSPKRTPFHPRPDRRLPDPAWSASRSARASACSRSRSPTNSAGRGPISRWRSRSRTWPGASASRSSARWPNGSATGCASSLGAVLYALGLRAVGLSRSRPAQHQLLERAGRLRHRRDGVRRDPRHRRARLVRPRTGRCRWHRHGGGVRRARCRRAPRRGAAGAVSLADRLRDLRRGDPCCRCWSCR